jgi:hypothetical protein
VEDELITGVGVGGVGPVPVGCDVLPVHLWCGSHSSLIRYILAVKAIWLDRSTARYIYRENNI